MSLVIATICEEGIALAADIKLTVLLKPNDPEMGEEVGTVGDELPPDALPEQGAVGGAADRGDGD